MSIKKNSHPIRLILIILVSLIALFPFLWMISSSFNSPENIFKTPPSMIPDLLFTNRVFSNYSMVFNQYSFGRYILNSLIICFFASFGQLFVCSLSGFAFAKMEFKGKNLIFSLLLVTLMIPVQVTIIPEYFIMLKLGWLDTFLPLIIPSFLVGSFGTFLLREFFADIPNALFDAAIIDGVDAWGMYKRIYLPQATASLATLFIIAFMNNWNDLLRPMLYLSKEKLQTVTLALTQFQSQYSSKWNLLLAGSVLSILPLILLFIFCQRYIIENTMNSGIKG